MLKKKCGFVISLYLIFSFSFLSFAQEETTSNEEKVFKFDQKKWNNVRQKIEQNLPLYEETVSTTTPPPVATPTTIEFIEGTQLSISGRKLIGMQIKSTQYPNRSEYNRTDVSMNQELQVSIRGKVGKNVDVNIDIDDTQPDKRDISIVYRGEGVDVGPGAVGYKAKPGAFIQEAAFGDIQLSLPNTEFVGYSRQVFGLKVTAQYNQTKLYLIASQSKGNFETKRFTGKTEFERKILYDISYKRRKYYDISFGGYKPKKDTIEVYLDTLETTRDPATLKELTAEAFSISTFTYKGSFEKLALGKDYIIDYAKGIIIFTLANRSIQQNWVIAIDYVDENTNIKLSDLSGTTNYILIKDKEETDGVTTELKNRYEIGRTNIVRDDGTGNFLLKITDKSNRVLDPNVDKIQPGDKPVPVYKSVNAGDIIVDFENGEFYFLSDKKPFADDCYSKTPVSRYNILIEYRYRSKTYFLKPFIVPYSERVTIDGKVKQRNVDYWIDYDSGFITFLKEEEITDNSVIEVSYEYSMLGLQGGETIAGGRLELPLAKKFFVGTSWIGSIPSKGTNVPDIRSTPSSLQVWETDARLVDFKIPFLPLNINSFSGEYAESEKNPNIWDKAIVENMEGINLEDSVSTYRHMWYYSSCNDVYIPGLYDEKLDKLVGGELNWENENVDVKEIYPNPAIGRTTDKQQVLKINYNLYQSTEVAMVYQFSKIGLDFSKKLYIEAEIYSDGKGGELYLDLGQMNEDIDQDKNLDTEDQNKNGVLDVGEDTGFEYNRGSDKYFINKGNGKLDTEDIDGDGVLNTYDKLASPTTGYKIADLDFIGWKAIRIPIEVDDKTKWSSVKQLRLRIRGNKKSGVLKIAKISVVGNRFEVLTSSTTKIYSVNNENEPSYKKLTELEEYSSIYGTQFAKEKTVEQALAIDYNFDTINSSSIVQLLYSQAQNFSYHHKFNFFLFNKTANNVKFKIRCYTDANNYVEYSTITANLPLNEWVKFTIDQVDRNYDNIPDDWDVSKDGSLGGECKRIGNPNLQRISRIEIILENVSGGTQQGTIYVNDIYLSESWKRKGIAKKLELNMSLPGWINFGGKIRSVDRNFETFTSAITNQDNTATSSYLNFIKLNFMPINFQSKQEQTITPSAIDAGNLVSTIDEGKKIYTEGKFETNLNISKLPQLGFNYTKSVSSATALSRTDMKDTFRTTLSYKNPLSKSLPLENISLAYSEEKLLLYPWQVNISTFPTVDNTRNINLNLPFNFWNLLTLNLSLGTGNTFTELRKFNRKIEDDLIIPNLSNNKDIFDYYTKLTFFSISNLQKTYEMYYTTYSIVISSYEKRSEWNTELNSSINILPFFKPSLGYKIGIVEDYNYSASPKTKDVTRNTSGSAGVSFMPKDIFNLKQIQSLRLYYNFTLTAGDKYEKLPKDYELLDFYNFKNLNLLWYQTEIATPTIFRTKLFERKEQRLNTRWKLFEGVPFKGMWEFLNKTDLTLSYSDAIEEKEETQTKSYSYTKVWPDINSTFYGIEDLAKIFVKKQDVITDTKVNLVYSYKTTEVKKVSFERNITHKEILSFSLFKDYNILSSYENNFYDNFSYLLNLLTTMSKTDIFGLQVGLPFFGQRLTPRYEYKKEYSEDARKLPTKDLTTHTFAVNHYVDIVPKQGVNIFGKTLPLQNRLRVNSTLQYIRRESSIDIGKTNTDQVSISSKADYDVSKYINISLGLGFDLNNNRVIKTETNYSYYVNSQVIIRF